MLGGNSISRGKRSRNATTIHNTGRNNAAPQQIATDKLTLDRFKAAPIESKPLPPAKILIRLSAFASSESFASFNPE
jgi:hypothetical protein